MHRQGIRGIYVGGNPNDAARMSSVAFVPRPSLGWTASSPGRRFGPRKQALDGIGVFPRVFSALHGVSGTYEALLGHLGAVLPLWKHFYRPLGIFRRGKTAFYFLLT